MKLSIVDNEVILSVNIIKIAQPDWSTVSSTLTCFALQGYSQVISNELVDFNHKFDRICTDSRSGILSTLSSMVCQALFA